MNKEEEIEHLYGVSKLLAKRFSKHFKQGMIFHNTRYADAINEKKLSSFRAHALEENFVAESKH